MSARYFCDRCEVEFKNGIGRGSISHVSKDGFEVRASPVSDLCHDCVRAIVAESAAKPTKKGKKP